MAAADAANINFVIEDHVLAIWPFQGARGGSVPLITPKTGLVGYPVAGGLSKIGLRTVYNPACRFGALIQLQQYGPGDQTPLNQRVLERADGKWQIIQLTHHLESQMPNGDWYSQMLCIIPPDRFQAQAAMQAH